MESLDWRQVHENYCAYFAFILLCLVSGSRCVIARQYTVGEDAGWTNIGLNYSKWVAGKTFFVGDILLFQYVPGDHNVLEIGRTSYKHCNLSSPIKRYTDGTSLVALNSVHKLYFVCGVAEHCSEGQKVQIDVHSSNEGLPPSASPTQNHAQRSSPTQNKAANNHLTSFLTFISTAIAELAFFFLVLN